jgi:hypothetical protein
LWLALAAAAPCGATDFAFSVETIRSAFEQSEPIVQLPMENGELRTFALTKTAFFPQRSSYPIRTLSGRAIDHRGCSAEVVLTPGSISAQIFLNGRVTYLNSVKTDAGELRLRYSPDDSRSAFDFSCFTPPAPPLPRREGVLRAQSDHVLRKFRLAPAATAEFTAYFGSREEAVRQVVIAMNRASGIFQRELGISFELVPGFERMVFTETESDPYTSNEPSEDLLKEAQAAFDLFIGTANYDLGIVLTRGTYGMAYIRSVCDPARKGASCVGLPVPVGDAFHVNLLMHELGHQFGAGHTFNSPAGLCAERRHEWSAFEPGAGSTIMSYASLPCDGDSFQSWHDPYFHFESLKEITDFLNSPAVSCAAITPGFNSRPAVVAGREYTIPVGTPFAVTATGSDPDGDDLTYCWEERDLGPAQALGAGDNGLSPLFRSYPPSASPTRIFPRLERVLAGVDAAEERLPQTNRMLRFRVTARDSHEQGALAWSDTQIRVVDNGGPFRITSHSSPQRLSGITRVEWNTGGAMNPPISASHVRISLSTDGGASFPTVLAASTPNDGSEDVQIPDVSTENARLKVEPTNNIFFDINDAPLIIGSPVGVRLQSASTRGGELQLSWASEPGKAYRLERATSVPPMSWNQILRTNATHSSISVTVPAGGAAGYYRLVRE